MAQGSQKRMDLILMGLGARNQGRRCSDGFERLMLGMVVPICNPSYLEVRKEDHKFPVT
jgi:hypothetical protein